jgi:hypothetical protein
MLTPIRSVACRYRRRKPIAAHAPPYSRVDLNTAGPYHHLMPICRIADLRVRGWFLNSDCRTHRAPKPAFILVPNTFEPVSAEQYLKSARTLTVSAGALPDVKPTEPISSHQR